MLDTVQELYNKIYKEDVFIVAGGSSVNSIDLRLLENKKIIAVTSSFELFKDPIAIYWCDPIFADNNYRQLEKFNSLKFTCRFKQKLSNIKGAYGATILKRTGDFGYDPKPNHVMGNNSGVQVLNLIINMCPKRILLLGYDMGLVNGNTHWHKKSLIPVPNTTYTDKFIPSIDNLAKDLLNYNNIPEIINCSPISKLTCFKFGNLKEYV